MVKRIPLRELALMILTVFLAMPIAQAYATLQVRRRVTTPVYQTNFENIVKIDANHLNMTIANYFDLGGGDGATMWMEGLDRHTPGITCHSGSRCVGMEISNVTESNRNEFNIVGLQNLVGQELFVSVWLYLPANWQLHEPPGQWNWYEVANPYFTGYPSYVPYSAIHFDQDDSSQDVFMLTLQNQGLTGPDQTLGLINNFPLPRGRWFNLQYYVFRDATNGIIRVWINGTLEFTAQNIPTKNPSTTDWFTTPAKIYYNPTDTFSPYQLWVDDLQIYNGSPL
jgi:hypothetical protein